MEIKWFLHVLERDFIRCRRLLISWWILMGFKLAYYQLLESSPIAAYVPTLLFDVAHWFFIAWILYEDNIVDPRGFWLTLPISRTYSLASKALIVVAGVTFPHFLVTVLGTRQVLPTELDNLLLYGSISSVTLVVVSLGLASITSNLKNFLAALIGFHLLPGTLLNPWVRSYFDRGSDLYWIGFRLMTPILIVLATMVLIYQYRTRSTRTSMILWGFLLSGFHFCRIW